jgi:hypothetical protein
MSRPTDGSFFVAPLAFDQPEVGPLYRDGSEVFGVFAYEDGPDETATCYFAEGYAASTRQARAWKHAETRGTLPVLSGILRYF